jgi:hypothetical protein
MSGAVYSYGGIIGEKGDYAETNFIFNNKHARTMWHCFSVAFRTLVRHKEPPPGESSTSRP